MIASTEMTPIKEKAKITLKTIEILLLKAGKLLDAFIVRSILATPEIRRRDGSVFALSI